jgi:hypothetical protein
LARAPAPNACAINEFAKLGWSKGYAEPNATIDEPKLPFVEAFQFGNEMGIGRSISEPSSAALTSQLRHLHLKKAFGYIALACLSMRRSGRLSE